MRLCGSVGNAHSATQALSSFQKEHKEWHEVVPIREGAGWFIKSTKATRLQQTKAEPQTGPCKRAALFSGPFASSMLVSERVCSSVRQYHVEDLQAIYDTTDLHLEYGTVMWIITSYRGPLQQLQDPAFGSCLRAIAGTVTLRLLVSGPSYLSCFSASFLNSGLPLTSIRPSFSGSLSALFGGCSQSLQGEGFGAYKARSQNLPGPIARAARREAA